MQAFVFPFDLALIAFLLLFLIFFLLVLLLVLIFVLFRRRSRRRPIVIDGSNVMHWQGNTPKLNTVAEVLATLTKRGFRPGVIFDANAGWKLDGRYCNDFALAARLGLPAKQVLVVPKGQPAGPTILAAARKMGAPIVTNDRYSDWAQTHPEVATPGKLIRGGYRDGELWLDLD